MTLDFIGKTLCKLGLHKWGKKYGNDKFISNVIDWTQKCERCGKLKKWVEAKPKNYGHRRSRD